MKILLSFEKILSKVVVFLTAIFFLVMVFLAFLQVVLRNFFSTGITWADVTVRHCVLWVGFFGAILAAIENRHIRLDLLSRLLPEKIKSAVSKLIYLGSAITCSILAYASYKFVLDEKMMGERLFGGVPIWIAQAIIPTTFTLVGIIFIIKLLEKE